jgi:NAD(P)-dependent dehydrogenase (short-subunit alcohol dehydrogenase family)
MTDRFEGLTSVVTGGVSGIGRATARLLAVEGSRVIVVDRAGDAWSSCRTDLGADARFVRADLSDGPSLARAAAEITDLTGRVDVLVNCAGVVHVDGRQENPFLDRGLAGWELLIAVNLWAPAALTHALRAELIAAEGAVVNVSSEGQFGARSTRWIYDLTKAAILSLTRSTAAAFAEHGVRVNSVAPGATITEMHLDDFGGPAAGREVLQRIELPNLLRRFAEPEEIAAAICFLASRDASYITGTTLAVDGGGLGIRG